MYGPNPVVPCWFSVWMICPLLTVEYWSPLLFFYCCLFLPSVLLVFNIYVNIFRCSVVGLVYIYDCYILLMNWPLYHSIMTFFVTCYCSWLKVYFVSYKHNQPLFLLVFTCLGYLLSSLCFQPVCVLKSEVTFSPPIFFLGGVL